MGQLSEKQYQQYLFTVSEGFLALIVCGIIWTLLFPVDFQVDRGLLVSLAIPLILATYGLIMLYAYIEPKRAFFVGLFAHLILLVGLTYLSDDIKSPFGWSLFLPVLATSLGKSIRATLWFALLAGSAILAIGHFNAQPLFVDSQELTTQFMVGNLTIIILAYVIARSQIKGSTGATEKEETVHASVAVHQAFLQHAGSALAIIDEDAKIIFWNNMAEQIFAVPAKQALGHELDTFLRVATPAGSFKRGDAIVVTKQLLAAEKTEEQVLVSRQGVARPMTVTVTPIDQRGQTLLAMEPILYPWGMVLEAKTHKPIELAVVRVTEVTSGKILETRATDRQGRFSFLVPSGKYTLAILKAGYEMVADPRKGYSGQVLNVREGAALSNILIYLKKQ